ncbi:hypothetical protein DL764_003264 [Monosporascus ibericus]|uniref:Uncharacterized protein n=1 Tax=Monosporascus ibericus TaxID=155417 RepID=A0A4Q4TL52_9PEZI|nr:hypothetical protein DL764_003264 [Monosporascus ibericus]
MSPPHDDPAHNDSAHDDLAHDDPPQNDLRIVVDGPQSAAATHDQSHDGDGEHRRGGVRAANPPGLAHEAAGQRAPVPNFYADFVIPRRRKYRPLREHAVSDGDSLDATGEAGLPGPSSTPGGATWPIRDGVDHGQPGHGDLRGPPDGASRAAMCWPVSRPPGCPPVSGFDPAAFRPPPGSGRKDTGATAGPPTAPQGHIGTAPPNAPRGPRGWRAELPVRPNPNGPRNNRGSAGESSSRPVANRKQLSGISDDHPSLAGHTTPCPPVPHSASRNDYSLPGPDNHLPPVAASYYFSVHAISDPNNPSETDVAILDLFEDGPGGRLFHADPDFVEFKTYLNWHIQGLGIEPTNLLSTDSWQPVTRWVCLFFRWLLSRNEWSYGSKLPGPPRFRRAGTASSATLGTDWNDDVRTKKTRRDRTKPEPEPEMELEVGAKTGKRREKKEERRGQGVAATRRASNEPSKGLPLERLFVYQLAPPRYPPLWMRWF